MAADDDFLTPEQDFENVLRSQTNLANQVHKLKGDDAARMCREIENLFECGQTRVWWLSMKHVIRAVRESETALGNEISRLGVESTAPVYFVPDNDNEKPLPVYLGAANIFECLLPECRYWECYFYLPSAFALIASTDHGEYMVSQARPLRDG